MNVTFDRAALPVLCVSDIVVIGGSFGGVAAALALARAGREVVLVEPRTYLGREVTATLRPWVSVPAEVDSAPLPEVILSCIEASGTTAVAGEVPLHMDAVKIELEDLLLGAGVKLIYASLPVGMCTEGGELQGVVIGNKSGRQVIVCQALLDASATALVARLASAEFGVEPERSAHFFCTLEFDGVGPLDGPVLPIPQRLGLVGDQAVVHRGYRGQGHVLIEYELALPSGGYSALEIMRREAAARRRTTEIAAYLMSEVSAFQEAYVATASYELYGPYTTRMAGPVPEWVRPLESVAVDVAESGGQVLQALLSSFGGPVVGLWCLNEAARVDGGMRALIRDPVVASRLGSSLGHVLDQQWEAISAPSPARVSGSPQRSSQSPMSVPSPLEVRELERPQRGRHYELHLVRASSVPVLRSAEVLVVGGGTSGAIAGITSAREGVETVIVDMNPGLGGTGTYGGIYTHWFFRRIGFTGRVMDWVDEMHDRLRLPRPEGVLSRWNIEAKNWALMEEAEDVGVEVLLNTLVISAVVEGDVVRGVVAATRTGPVALLGEVVVDATGDGDVAAFAGAEYVYGSERDHVVMWALLPAVIEPGRPRNIKTSMVDISNIEDYTRIILEERRRRVEGDHDHVVYLGPRESRHITADVVLTLTDQLLRRCWPDVVCIAFSNHDIKGQSTSDWVRMGLQPPNLEIEIPYRALLPKRLENILVVGKAFSATHDALAAPRMQPDLENLGGAAGLAAAMAVRDGRTPRDIDVKALQAELVEVGALPGEVLNRTLAPLEYTEGELKALIGSLTADPPLDVVYSCFEGLWELGERYDDRVPLVDVMCAGPQVVPLLEAALGQAEGRRQVLLARALAILGSQAGVPVLLSAMGDQLAGDRLPTREKGGRYPPHPGGAIEFEYLITRGGYPPNQGRAPELAYLIYSLGLARDRRALSVWQRVVDLLASATEEDVLERWKGLYYYVTAVCYGAERLGDPAAIPILQQLHSYAPFCNQALLSGFEPDFLKERLAHLELLIGRALARCGSPDGVAILIGYLDDVRTLLAEHAHAELMAITGQDLGKEAELWRQWLEVHGGDLEPIPWLEPTEPIMAWDEVILTTMSGV